MIEQIYPVDPVNYGRFPTYEKKRLDALGDAAMLAKNDRDTDPLRKALRDKKEASGLTWEQVGAQTGLNGTQLCGFASGSQPMSDERRQIIRSWITGDFQKPQLTAEQEWRKRVGSAAGAAARHRSEVRIAAQRDVAKRLKETIISLGISKSRTAMEVGMSRSQLSDLIKGAGSTNPEAIARIEGWLAEKAGTAKPAAIQEANTEPKHSDNFVLIDRINKLEIQLQAAQARLMQLSEPSMVVEDGFKDRWQGLHNRQVELTGKLTTLEKFAHETATKLGWMTTKLNRRMDDISLRMTIERTDKPERPSFFALIRQRLAL